MRLLSRMNNGQAGRLSAHSPTCGTGAVPLRVGYVSNGKGFSWIRRLPSSSSAHGNPALFEGFMGTTPRSDASETYRRAVRPKPSPAHRLSVWTAGVSEVSRFSCLKFLGVSGVFDYAGLSKSSRERACSGCLPCISRTSASGLHLFGAEYPPHLSSVTLRCVARGSSARLEAERIATPFS